MEIPRLCISGRKLIWAHVLTRIYPVSYIPLRGTVSHNVVGSIETSIRRMYNDVDYTCRLAFLYRFKKLRMSWRPRPPDVLMLLTVCPAMLTPHFD